jgi:hypothetical protein
MTLQSVVALTLGLFCVVGPQVKAVAGAGAQGRIPGGGNLAAMDLGQTVWSGQEEGLPGYDQLHFFFQPGGQVRMVDADKVPRQGSYTINQGRITLLFFDGKVKYYGDIRLPIRAGATIEGIAMNGKNEWTFSVTMQPQRAALPRRGPQDAPPARSPDEEAVPPPFSPTPLPGGNRPVPPESLPDLPPSVPIDD